MGRLREDAPAVPWPDGRPAGGRLLWTGVAGVLIELEGCRIAFDPFVSRPGVWRVVFARPRPDASRVERTFGRLDAVFVGHAHYDHAMDLPALPAAGPRRPRIHGGPTAIELCRRRGVPAERLEVVPDGGAVDVGPFRVEAVGSRHGKVPLVGPIDRRTLGRGLPWTPFRYPRGEVLAWRVEAAGRTFHVQGSAGIEVAPLARQGRADLLLACLAARHGTPGYLARLGAQLRPAVLAPIHHDHLFRSLDGPPRPVPGLDWPAFLADAADLERRHGTRLWCPPRGVPADW